MPGPLTRSAHDRLSLLNIFRFAPLLLVSLLMAWCYWTTAISLCISFLWLQQRQPRAALLLFTTFNFLFCNAAWSLAVVMIRGPGFAESGGSYEEMALEARRPLLDDDAPGTSDVTHPTADEIPKIPANAQELESESDGVSSDSDDRLSLDSSKTDLEDRIERHLDDFVATAAPYVALTTPGMQAAARAADEGSLMVKANGQRRYCSKCQLYKADRSHHCSQCKRCILRHDHHCGVIGICIGLRNHKAFLLFVTYTALLCLDGALGCLYGLACYVSGNMPEGFDLAVVSWAMNMFLSFVFSFVLISFAVYHLWLVKQNKTTIESMEATRIDGGALDHGSLTREQRRALRRASSKLHPFDLGTKRNFSQVFESRYGVWGWFFPIGEPLGDGRTYPINHRNLAKLHELTADIANG